jgi:hypothetical protein
MRQVAIGVGGVVPRRLRAGVAAAVEERTRNSTGGESWVQRQATYVVRLCWCLLCAVVSCDGGECAAEERTRNSSCWWLLGLRLRYEVVVGEAAKRQLFRGEGR